MSTLFVSDLDGTLLGADGRLSSTSDVILRRLLADGVAFTVATARSWVSMRGCLGPLPLRLPVVCANGAFITHFDTGSHHEIVSIPEGVARQIHRAARDAGLDPMVGVFRDGDERLLVPRNRSGAAELYVGDLKQRDDPRLREVVDPAAGLGDPCTGLTLIERPARLEPLHAHLARDFAHVVDATLADDFYYPGWAWLTIHAAAANKGRATHVLVEQHMPANTRLVVFGDQVNDLPMFERADYAVATANAVPAIKALADEVIGHHEEDSVARWLEAHLGSS